MKKSTLIALITLVITQLSFSQDIYKRIAINNPSTSLQELISSKGIDLSCGVKHDHGKLVLELSKSELDLLDNSGISYNVEINDLTRFYQNRIQKTLPKALADLEREKARTQAMRSSNSSVSLDNFMEYTGAAEIDWATPTNFNLGSMGGCLTVSEVEAELDQMRSLYPSLISSKTDASPTNQTTHGNTLGSAGNQWPGQTVYYTRITGNQASAEGSKPQTLYTSMIHSREVGSLMSNIYFMWYLLENYATDPAVKHLVDNNELYFIPVVNPDGLKWNETIAPSGGGMQRKNLRPNAGDSGSTSSSNTSRGVDLNRNFDYFWGSAGSGSSGTTSSDSYRGPSAFSEPETQILRDFVLARNFESVLMNHTSGNAIPHPYGGNPTFVSGRENEMHKWHEDMTRYNRYVSGATIFSAANGIADDWMVGGNTDANGSTGSGQNILATTPEHGGSGFWPPTNDIVPIAKRAMRISLMTAYYGGKYAKFHDLTQSNISTLTSDLKFGIERLGQTSSNFTLTLTPISGNITSIAAVPVQTGMTILEQREVTTQLILDGSIQANDKIEYQVQLANGDGIVFYDVNIEKYYQPSVLLSDNPDSDLLTNWTTSGIWTASTEANAIYSGTRAIKLGGNAVSAYSHNDTRTLTTATSYDLSGASEILIQYYSKWDLERNFDFVEILGSTNGSTWQPLTGKYTKPSATNSTTNAHGDKSGTSHSFQNNNSSGQVYDGDQMDKWVMEEIVIDATNNNFLNGATTAYIQFRFRSDSNNKFENYSASAEGFFIDDFKIMKIQIPCDSSSPPTGILADVTATALSAIVSWDNIPSSTYDVRYREIGAPSWTEITDIATNSYTINSLTDGTDYEVQVRTRCTSNTSSYSTSTNFTGTSCTGSVINTFPYSESFETDLGGWTDSATDDFSWTRKIEEGDGNSTPSSNTGPADASDQSYFLYTEASDPNFPSKNAILISPCLDFTGKQNASFSFDYHMFGAYTGELKVEVSTDNGSNYTTLNTLTGQQNTGHTDPWKTQAVNLNAYDGQIIKLRFSATTHSNITDGWQGDISIDNFSITASDVVLTTWYRDADSDTFGDPGVTQDAATQPAGYVADNTDCDDNDNTIHPNTVWYLGVDNDSDTFFGSQITATQCISPGAGYSTSAPTLDDCDDNDNTIHPNTVWYLGVDNDSDTFFGSQITATQCISPGAGYSTSAPTLDDCDDNDNTIHPNTVWYLGVDTDSDTFFGSQITATQCTSPGAGYSTSAPTLDDCDDNDNTIHPNTVWYLGVDADSDTFFGSQITATQCTSPGAGYSTSAPTLDDCDDNDNTIHPNTVWYLGVDNDSDTFFGSQITATQCTSPGAGYSTSAPTLDDCDDNDNTIHPNTVWYLGVDTDSDTFFGSQITATQCTSPGAGYSTSAPTLDDCDDNDNTIHPDAIEIVDNAIDENCDGTIEYSLGEKELDLDKIQIVPNPFNSFISIQLPNNTISQFNISVFDINGRVIFNKTASSFNGKININSLNNISSGAYLIKITNTTNGKNTIKKLIKE